MSLNQEERIAIVTYRLEKADRALQQAKAILPCADSEKTIRNNGKH